LNGQNRFFGHAAALFTVFVWGFAFVTVVVLLRSFSPVEILFYRFTLATLALYVIYPRKMKRNTLKQELLFAFAGLFGVTSYFLLQDTALLHTAASNASVIVSFAPILTGLLVWLFVTKERPNGSFFLGAVCAVMGVALISFAGIQLELHPLGDFLVFVSALSWAIYSVLLKKIGELGHHPIQVIRRVFIYGLLFLIPFMIATGFQFEFQCFTEPVNLLSMLYLAFLSSATGFVLWNFALGRLGPVRVSGYLYLIPIITVVASVLVLDQTVTLLKASGIGLVLIGLVLSNRRTRAKEPPERERPMKYDCLIVDDEQALSESTCEYFNLFDVKTAWVADELSCLDFFRNNEADLILLDINLGEASGFDLCKHLRKTMDIPILFISARTSDDDMLLALNIGGDDYIQKPYSLSVLLAKVKAVLKRYQGTVSEADVFAFGDVRIDFTTNSVFREEEKLELKAMEYKLLSYLVRNRNRVLSKDELFKEVWEDSFVGDNTLNVHVRHLREKIEENPKEPRYIKTIWGTGYVFEVNET